MLSDLEKIRKSNSLRFLVGQYVSSDEDSVSSCFWSKINGNGKLKEGVALELSLHLDSGEDDILCRALRGLSVLGERAHLFSPAIINCYKSNNSLVRWGVVSCVEEMRLENDMAVEFLRSSLRDPDIDVLQTVFSCMLKSKRVQKMLSGEAFSRISEIENTMIKMRNNLKGTKGDRPNAIRLT